MGQAAEVVMDREGEMEVEWERGVWSGRGGVWSVGEEVEAAGVVVVLVLGKPPSQCDVGHGLLHMEVGVIVTCCVAALLLYSNTLHAQFAYDDRYESTI